jgi:hypothetical protein
MVVKVPSALAAVLAEPVTIGVPAQAFPFLTVDEAGAPHCCLLSSAEIAVAPGGAELYVALTGRRPRANLEARRRATLLTVSGTTLHSCTLALAAVAQHEGVLATALTVVDHTEDSLGIELVALGFVPPAHIAALEHWDVTAAALDAIRNLRSEDVKT